MGNVLTHFGPSFLKQTSKNESQLFALPYLRVWPSVVRRLRPSQQPATMQPASQATPPGGSKEELLDHARRAAKNRGGGGPGNSVSRISTVAYCTAGFLRWHAYE